MLSIIYSLTKNIVIPPQKIESIHNKIGCIQSNDKYNNYNEHLEAFHICLEKNELNTCIERYKRYDYIEEVNKCPQEIIADNIERFFVCLESVDFNECFERLSKLE